MDALLQTLKNLGPARLAVMAIVAAVLLGVMMFLPQQLSNPSMSLLYSDLSMSDAGAIANKLETLEIPYKVSSSGTEIMVPMNDVGRVRMMMAQEGLPSGGSVGYEIFNKSDSFGTTSFVQNINHLRALEGELARTISTLSSIQQARVHLVLPRREMFARESYQPSASVFVKPRNNATLNREQISAIQHLVAAAVPQLTPTQVSIVDDKGSLLARGGADENDNMAISDAKEQRYAYEQRIANTIEDLLSRTVGYGKVRAEVSAEMDFDRISKSIESYDPESAVLRSKQTTEEQNQSTNSQGGAGTVSVANNLPAAPPAGGAGSTSNDSNTRNEETLNYEISRTVTQHVQSAGQVKKLSVAVLVDGIYKNDAKGVSQYTARTPEELKQIETLVKSAIGFDTKRGDSVEVINMQFVDNQAQFDNAATNEIMGIPKPDLMHFGEILLTGILSLIGLLLVVRPVLIRLLEQFAAAKPEVVYEQNALGGPSNVVALPGQPGQMALSGPEGTSHEPDKLIDMDKIEGKVRESSIKKVSEIVDNHPEETVAIVRNWMTQET